MHEFLLFGQVSSHDHRRALQQLAGVTRMQPQPVAEFHLVYKARPPIGLGQVNSTGASQEIVPPEVQKTRSLLSSSLFYVKLIGELIDSLATEQPSQANRDVAMEDGSDQDAGQSSAYRWRLEFRDIPDAGKQPVTIRLMTRMPIEGGDVSQFLYDYGFEYVSRYAIVGDKLYDQDTTLFLHKILQMPPLPTHASPLDPKTMEKLEELNPLDSSGGYVLQVSMEVMDGNNPELKERATRQLTAIKEIFKQSIPLSPGDRLALDTRVPIPLRRP